MPFDSVLSQFSSRRHGRNLGKFNSILSSHCYYFSFKIYQTDAITEAKQLFSCLFIFARCISIGNLSVHLYECVYHTLTYGAEPFLRSRQLGSHSRTSQHFMEPEGSLLCSSPLPFTGPYPEPDRSSPYHPIQSL
jgi:hypothetical protein